MNSVQKNHRLTLFICIFVLGFLSSFATPAQVISDSNSSLKTNKKSNAKVSVQKNSSKQKPFLRKLSEKTVDSNQPSSKSVANTSKLNLSKTVAKKKKQPESSKKPQTSPAVVNEENQSRGDQTVEGIKTMNLNREPKITPIIAEVNGESIGAYGFEQLLVEQLQAGVIDSVELRKTVRNELVIQTILSQQSIKEGLDQLPEFEQSMESARRVILSKLWRKKWLMSNPVAENEIYSEYNATIKRLGETEFRIRQVVLKDKTAADLILVQIGDGKEIAELASKYSVEFKGKENKGLLPWVSPSVLLPPIGEKIKNAKVGDLLDTPIKTEVGWHVVKIEGIRPLFAPTYEKMKPEIKVLLSEKGLNQAIQKLVDESKVQF